MILVLENCSKIIFRNTVIGIAIIKPGMPHKNPQNISITNTAIMFIEKDLPIKIGSKIAPKTTWTRVIESTKKKSVLVGSNSTNAKIDNKITVFFVLQFVV